MLNNVVFVMQWREGAENRFNTGGEEVIEREFSFETQVVRVVEK